MTRVIAPSSTRTLAGHGGGDLAAAPPGSGGWPQESVAIRQSDGDPGAQVGRLELDAQAPVEAVAQPLGEPRQRLGRAVAGEHDLLAGGVQGVEGVDELLLGVLLALEHLDVVDQQRVELAIARLEGLGPVAAQGGDELGGEPLRGRVVDLELRVVAAQVLDDRAEQVGLAEARAGRGGRAGCRPRRAARRRRARRRGRAGCRGRSRSARRCGCGRAAATAGRLRVLRRRDRRPPARRRRSRSGRGALARDRLEQALGVAALDPGAHGRAARRRRASIPARRRRAAGRARG